MNKITIPQYNTKPKKITKVNIEGDEYNVNSSVLVAYDATKIFNKLSSLTNTLNNEDGKQMEVIEQIYTNSFKLFDILLGEKNSKKLVEKIDARYDTETATTAILQYAMSL
jgi:hypothetical protein